MGTEERFLEEAIRATEAALAHSRFVVNEMKGTVWTSHRDFWEPCGTMPRTTRASSWRYVRGTLRRPGQPSTDPDYRRATRALLPEKSSRRPLSQHIQEITDNAPPGLPAAQAASCPLRECIPTPLNALKDPSKRPPVPRDPLPRDISDFIPAREFELEEHKFARNLRSSRRSAAG